jgi:hypothetical protein
MRTATFSTLAATVLLVAVPAHSQEALPAVDGPSGKLTLSGGGGNGNPWGGLEGAMTFPLANRFGMQLDLAGGSVNGPREDRSAFYGAGAHVFWRDPSKGMVGIEAGGARLDALGGLNLYSAGVEAERYFGSVTLGGVMGLVDGSHATRSTSQGEYRYGLKRQFVAGPYVTWYPNDNLALSASGAIAGDNAVAGLGVEFAPATDSAYQPSFFVRGYLGEGGRAAALAGVTFYFGGRAKSLIRRQREDDPPIGNLASLGTKGGIGMALGAIWKFKKHKDNPTQIPPTGQ